MTPKIIVDARSYIAIHFSSGRYRLSPDKLDMWIAICEQVQNQRGQLIDYDLIQIGILEDCFTDSGINCDDDSYLRELENKVILVKEKIVSTK